MKSLIKNYLFNTGREIVYTKNYNPTIKQLVKDGLLMEMSQTEAQNLINLSNYTRGIKGEIAEVGTYKGGSTICLTQGMGDRYLFTHDTFEGILKPSKYDDSSHFHEGQYKSDWDSVIERLNKISDKIKVVKGKFQDTKLGLWNHRFSLVHLDVDLYETTLDALEFFWNRMSTGGVIITHDFQSARGVEKAFREFCYENDISILEFAGTSQAMIIK